MATILCVDDEFSVVNLLAFLIRNEGHRVETAMCGEEAMDKVMADHFNLIITDIRMHNVDGIELLRFVRRENPGLPVIVLSAYLSFTLSNVVMDLDAYDFITKPPDIPSLLKTIRYALEDSMTGQAHETAPSHWPRSGYSLRSKKLELERKYLMQVLESCRGDIVQAADALKMPARTLERKIADHGISLSKTPGVNNNA